MKALSRSRMILLLALMLPGALLAQVPPGWDATEFQISRLELQELLTRYESVLNSSGYSGDLREHARRSADLIRSRLEEGDFRAGDRVSVRLASEPDLFPDTLLVERGPAITLVNIGKISLHGVLRSELEDYLTAEISRFIRNPELTVQSYVRLSFQGRVGAPGFYVFPAETLLADALMVAGGPAEDSRLDQIRVRRGDERLMTGAEVLTALDEGRSLDQLGLRAGDEISIPQRVAIIGWPTVIQVGATLLTAVVMATFIIR